MVQPTFNDQECEVANWPTTAVVQSTASGQDLLPQSGLIGGSSGQHGMSAAIPKPAMSMPVISISAIGLDEDESEEAIALSATPMPTGPTTIPSRAATKSNLCNAFISFMTNTLAR